MKLDKKGWGLSNEIIFLLIFVICIVIVFVALNKIGLFKEMNPNYYSNTNTSTETKKFDYTALETKLRTSTINYIKEVYNNELGLDTLIIKASLLRSEGYLTNYVDETDKYCTGYSEVYLENNEIKYIPYVKCGKNYESKGYLERKDSK